ncbi:MAG TPA: HPr family phosphocarrier protein [Eubacteriales bacterium]|nr:HPr family phosphocarrier protein [Eubacteriales bacterium]
MITRQTTIVNASGLHARPASDFVRAAKAFSSKVTVKNLNTSGEAVSAKSILRLLAEGITQGTRIELSAEGEDEQSAVDTLTALIDSGFGE